MGRRIMPLPIETTLVTLSVDAFANNRILSSHLRVITIICPLFWSMRMFTMLDVVPGLSLFD